MLDTPEKQIKALHYDMYCISENGEYCFYWKDINEGVVYLEKNGAPLSEFKSGSFAYVDMIKEAKKSFLAMNNYKEDAFTKLIDKWMQIEDKIADEIQKNKIQQTFGI